MNNCISHALNQPLSRLPVFPHKLKKLYRVAHRMNVAGVAFFVNGPDGNGNPVSYPSV